MNKIAPNVIGKTVGKLGEIANNLPVPDVARALTLFLEYKKENETTKREIARCEAMKEIMVAEITMKYDFYEKLFASVFAERKTAIDKYFEIIDKSIKENNNELVLAGLSNLSNVVASSPFSNIGELKNLIEANKMIEM